MLDVGCFFTGSNFTCRWAERFNFAVLTIRPTRDATAATVPDEPMTEQRPLLLRNERHQLRFNLHGVLLFREAETIGQASDVRVHDDTNVDVERVSQNHVRRLAPNAVELNQFLHRARHLAAVTFDEFAAARLDVLRLVAEKACRLDGLLQCGQRRVRIIRRRAIFFEQLFRDEVDALVSALCGKNRGDEQFERARVIQLAMRVGISPLKRGDDFFQARGFGIGGFA